MDKSKKDLQEPYIIIGGDFNETNMDTILERFHDLRLVKTKATRGNNVLDKIITNLHNEKTVIRSPLLESSCQTKKSDYSVIHFATNLRNVDKFQTKTIKVLEIH